MVEPNPEILDLVYLRLQVAGDRQLERELLRLLEGQCVALLPDLNSEDKRTRTDAAHSLKGAAAGLGARRLAKAADHIEAGRSPSPDIGSIVSELRQEIRSILGEQS